MQLSKSADSRKLLFGLLIIEMLLVNAFAATLIIKPTLAPAAWWNTDWWYRKEIIIDNTKVNGDLTDFPVLIDITDADLAAKAQTGGDDIAFTDEVGTQLSHEIESYNSVDGHLVAWVRANLSSSTDTVLYMYYGNAGASNQDDVEGVWDSNYVMVQHLEESEAPEVGRWNKYAGNPILSGTRNGFASVFFDSDTAVYHLFCSWGSVLHFTSANGNSWTPDPSNPVLSGAGVPMVWKENSVWYMLYRYGSPVVVGLATSTDGTVWTTYAGNPVLTGDAGQWDDRDLDPWGIMKVDSTYYFWYNTIGSVPGLGRCVGLATSTDLTSWTKDPNNPIFTGGRFCVFPFKHEGYYYMLVPRYTTGPYGEIELYRDVNPTFYPGSREYLGVPIVPGSPGEWDDHRFDTPCVLTDTIYRDTYQASNNELWVYYASTGSLTGSGADWWTGMCIETNISEAISKLEATPPPAHLDSTANNNDGQPLGSVNIDVAGLIDGADDFERINGYVDCGDSLSLKGMSALTIEAWVNPEQGNNGIVSKWGGWTPGTGGSYILWQSSLGAVGWGVITETASASFYNTPTLQNGRWHHLVGVYDGSQIRLYLNASQVGTPQALTGNVASTDNQCYIGRYTTVYMNGTIDEVRISNMSRSDDWISTEYNNQYSPSEFYTVGSEETSPAVPNTPPVASNLVITPSSPLPTDDLHGSYTFSDVDGDPEVGSEIRWYKDNVLQPTYNDLLTVPSTETSANEEWYFTVRPSDGEDFGTLQTSPSVTIRAPVTYVFTDGFEVGVPGTWDYRFQSGATITQSSVQAHHGSYSARADVTAVGGYAVLIETLSPLLSTAHMRCYVYFTAFPSDTYQTAFLWASGDAGAHPNNNIVAATVYNDGGTVKWAMVYENSGDYRATANTPLPQLNTWHCVEIKILVHGTSGEARMYVDGVEILAQTGLDNDAYGNVEYCAVGSSSMPIGTPGVATCYIDCVAVADAYIGCEVELPDVNPPTYSDVGVTSTWAGEPCLFHAQWTDDRGLSGYIFSTDNTGVWTNDTWTPMTGLTDWSNVTKVLNPTVGVVVQYRFYCNDTSDNWNSMPIQLLTTTQQPVTYTSELSIFASSSPALVGYKVNIVGTLIYEHNASGIPDAPIHLYYSLTEGVSWNIITLTATTSAGTYSATWFPMATGNYLIGAVYTGEERPNVIGDETQITLVITGIEDAILSVSSNSTVSSLTFNSTTREITFSVEGPSGTIGYTNIFLAKSLAPDISSLAIYIDEIPQAYEAISNDDAWFIHLTYNHSIHTVRITLPSISQTDAFTELATTLIAIALVALGTSLALLSRIRRKKVPK